MLVNLHKALTNIQNGYSANNSVALVPDSFTNFVILNLLAEAGYIGTFQAKDHKFMVQLKYFSQNQPALKRFKFISSPSRRIFMGASKLKQSFSASDFTVLSTSFTRSVRYSPPAIGVLRYPLIKDTGIITLSEAIQRNVGGEILFSIL